MSFVQPLFVLSILLLLGGAGCSADPPPPPVTPPPTATNPADTPPSTGTPPMKTDQGSVATQPQTGADPEPALPEGLVIIGHPRTLHHIGVGDVNGDGRMDLTLSSHPESIVETYVQFAPRQFKAGGPYPNPGFHPNDTLTLVGADGQPYVALNAETANVIRVYRHDQEKGTEQVGEAKAPSPQESVLVEWPGWGRTLAVTSRNRPQLQLLAGFDPARPAAATATSVMLSSQPGSLVTSIVALTLAPAAPPTLALVLQEEGRVLGLDPLEPGQVQMRDLWQFERTGAINFLVPLDFNDDGYGDLFALGELTPEATLLLNDRHGGFTAQTFTVDRAVEHGVKRSAAVTREVDGSLLLWSNSDEGLSVLRWEQNRAANPLRRVLPRPGGDAIRFAVADLDADGQEDLALGSSTGALPASVIFGPLVPRLATLGPWLAGMKEQADLAREQRKEERRKAREQQGGRWAKEERELRRQERESRREERELPRSGKNDNQPAGSRKESGPDNATSPIPPQAQGTSNQGAEQ